MKRKLSEKDYIIDAAIHVILALFTLICIFPFYYIFINTVSNNAMASAGKVLFLPLGVHLDNYAQVFNINGLEQATFISLARTVVGTVFSVFGSSFMGYVLTKKELWKRKLWYRYVIITMYFNVGLIPWFVTMKLLGLVNNFAAYVLPAFTVPFFLILFKTYIEQIPDSLEESAQIDGAGYLTRYIRIIIPLSAPIIATIAIFESVDQWNAFMDTLFLMQRQSLYTLQFLLYQYLHQVDALAKIMRTAQGGTIDPSKMLTPTSMRMTISMVVVLPILLVYPFFQRYFVKGIMIGAIKG